MMSFFHSILESTERPAAAPAQDDIPIIELDDD